MALRSDEPRQLRTLKACLSPPTFELDNVFPVAVFVVILPLAQQGHGMLKVRLRPGTASAIGSPWKFNESKVKSKFQRYLNGKNQLPNTSRFGDPSFIVGDVFAVLLTSGTVGPVRLLKTVLVRVLISVMILYRRARKR